MLEATPDSRMESRARRAAARLGLKAIKSRRHRGTSANVGKFCLVAPAQGRIIAGERFDLSPDDVLDYCEEAARSDDRFTSGLG